MPWPSEVHVLLTYSCNFECDHCFVYSGPEAEGTFTLSRLRDLLDQARAVESVKRVCFEGGEAFLFFPLLVEGVAEARIRGFEVAIVTNSYWAETEEDAALWLLPLAELGISSLSVSDDAFHFGDQEETPAQRAARAARELGIPVDSIRIDPARVDSDETRLRGQPIVGGAVRFRGRAADRLTDGLPRRPWQTLIECPYEELERPSRVHVDAYGHVQVCQGLSIGNVWETPLAQLVDEYDGAGHPICGPLLEGGPARLADALDVSPEPGYVDECHLCYSVRRASLDEFPQQLAPRQVYGSV